ncbi:unnamed protein product [Adineta ricciae]|uniref:Uncharacterized protein n=1 Tax=Adineta ricciae TaxID=249248 RepID=A0A814S420_ADIRI|nr:unnamed protein product [Adineta ricciae]
MFRIRAAAAAAADLANDFESNLLAGLCTSMIEVMNLTRSGRRASVGGSTGRLGRKSQVPRPFPVITAQSYIPGAAGAALVRAPPVGGNPSSGIPPNIYPQPPPATFQPPMNLNAGPGYYPPPGPVPISRQSRNLLPGQDPSYRPRFHSQSHSRPTVRVHRHRSRRCRPVIHIIESDSCSSLSTCSSVSSCSPYCRRSYSCPRRSGTCPQQPIIFLPVQCRQQPPAIMSSDQNQAQPCIVPSTQFLQSNLALPSISAMQPSLSMPQIVSGRKPQLYQAGPITYVQTAPKLSSSHLRPIPAESRSNIPQQSDLVDSTNTKRPNIIKPIPRACSTQTLPQNDMKFRRYETDGQETFSKEKLNIEKRRETHFP